MKRMIAISAGLVILVVGWYLFRPELLFLDRAANEGFPGAGSLKDSASAPAPKVLLMGRFHDVAHEGRGVATIYQVDDGTRVLRFTDFKTSNGPDLYVYMVATDDADDSQTVEQAAFVNLGALKGNVGDQNYELPTDLDLDTYRAVTVWCRRFGVNFATAPLAPRSG